MITTVNIYSALSCAKHCAMYFSFIRSFNLHNRPMRFYRSNCSLQRDNLRMYLLANILPTIHQSLTQISPPSGSFLPFPSPPPPYPIDFFFHHFEAFFFFNRHTWRQSHMSVLFECSWVGSLDVATILKGRGIPQICPKHRGGYREIPSLKNLIQA